MASFSIFSILFAALIFLAFRAVRHIAGRHQTINNEETSALVEEETEVAPYIPPSITEEILARLPVKSILRFRSVNKDWNRLLTDSAFIKKHLKYATENDETHGFLLHFRSNPFQLFQFIPFSTFDEEKTVMLDNPEMEGYSSMNLVGSSNGLLCLSENNLECYKSVIFLLNPATREYKKLPNFDYERLQGLDLYASLGFGFDPQIEDYKVVKIIHDGNSSSGEVQVYSLRTNSWRSVTYVPYIIGDNRSKAILHGSMHWLALDGRMGGGLSSLIVSFNIADEVFDEIPLPVPGSIVGSEVFLQAFKGCLYVIYINYVRSSTHRIVDVWVMEEYGRPESWTRSFIVIVPKDILRPLQFWENGKLVLETLEADIVSYDPATHGMEFLQNGGENQELFPYVQSLVSLQVIEE